jgi:hypothetical protein
MPTPRYVTPPSRYVSLWLSDFASDPHEVAEALPVRPYIVSREGAPMGVRRLPTRRNLLVYRRDFSIEDGWSEAVEALIGSLGGWDAVGTLLARLECREPMVQFQLPVRNSPHQENNFLDSATLRRLAELEVDLGMEFGEYSPGDEQ